LCRIFDAKTGLIGEDRVKVWDLVTCPPWPEPSDKFPPTSRLTTPTPRDDLRGAGDAAEGPRAFARNDPIPSLPVLGPTRHIQLTSVALMVNA
jgi:hypothetical protein